jgi:hypothetical protein
MRQIHSAIEHLYRGDYECAITLAGAGEGMLPDTWKPHFRKKLKEFEKLPAIKKEGGATGPNDFKNWLKHGTLKRGGERVEAATIQRKKASSWSFVLLRNSMPCMMIFPRKCLVS